MPITFGKSLDNLKDKIIFTDKDIDNLANEILQALADRLLELIQTRAPFNTGVYAADWEVKPIKENTITISNPDDKLFIILEFTGRAPGKIEGNPFLHFTINGKDIIVRSVFHPGTQPEPHVRPAIEDLEREGKKIMIDTIKRLFPIFK